MFIFAFIIIFFVDFDMKNAYHFDIHLIEILVLFLFIFLIPLIFYK